MQGLTLHHSFTGEGLQYRQEGKLLSLIRMCSLCLKCWQHYKAYLVTGPLPDFKSLPAAAHTVTERACHLHFK